MDSLILNRSVWALGALVVVLGSFEALYSPSLEPKVLTLLLSLIEGTLLVAAVNRNSAVVICGFIAVQFVAAFALAGSFPIAIFLSSFPMLALLWIRGERILCALGAGTVLYLYSTSIEQGIWVPHYSSLILNALLVLATLTVSELFVRLRLARSAEEERRNILAQRLHAQVAGALTRALLELECLTDAAFGKSIKIVEADIREALVGSRELLDILAGSSKNDVPAKVDISYTDLAEGMIDELTERGFTVSLRECKNLQLASREKIPAALVSVIAELTQNIIKYADKSGPVVIELKRVSNEVIFEILNDKAIKGTDSSMGSGFGVSTMESIVGPMGGTISSMSAGPKIWSTKLSMPISERGK